MKIIQYLNQAFPKLESKWKVIVSISAFVALFLMVFKPFGISRFESNIKYLILSGYGFVTFCILILDLILIENIFLVFFIERDWKIWKEFVWTFWVIFTIGLGNAIYTSMVFSSFELSLSFILRFQFVTFVVGIIPITVEILTKQKYLLRKHLNSADSLNKNIQEKNNIVKSNLITFFADNEKDSVEFDICDFFYIESSGNYIEIHLLKEEKVIRKTFRSTLKRSLDYFKDCPEVIQCHRAFLINTNNIINVKGNSQGLRLSLKNCDVEIPVSRGFVASIRERIN